MDHQLGDLGSDDFDHRVFYFKIHPFGAWIHWHEGIV